MVVNPIDTSLLVSRAYGGPPVLAVPFPVTPTYAPLNPHPDAVSEIAPIAPIARPGERLGRFVDRYA